MVVVGGMLVRMDSYAGLLPAAMVMARSVFPTEAVDPPSWSVVYGKLHRALGLVEAVEQPSGSATARGGASDVSDAGAGVGGGTA